MEKSLAPKGSLKGIVAGVAVAEDRGASKKQVTSIKLKEAYGVLGDGHAGTQKQVSLVAIEDIDDMNKQFHIQAAVGDFAENIATRGIDLMALSPGDQIQVGPVVLRVFCIGKSPEEMKNHTFSFKGHVLLPEKGLFCNVVKGGRIRTGDDIFVINQDSSVNHNEYGEPQP